MPRARVDDAHRKRVLHACTPCKVSKKRCDGRWPCHNCARRKGGHSCAYDKGDPVPRGASPASKSVSQPVTAETTTTKSAQHGEEATGPAARMLWTSRGIYIGSSASLTFLHLLRDTLSRYMGPSAFTDDSHKGFMLETQAPDAGITHQTECFHAPDEEARLIDVCFAVTAGIVDVLSKEEALRHAQSMRDTPHGSTRDALVHAMLAIGAQCRGGGAADQHCERVHMAKAQRAAFDSFLESPTLDLTRTFILLAFYMFGACRRNAAFMYIGVAARAANALGMHHEASYRSGSHEDNAAKSMAWKSIRILDLLVAALLGRSPSTPDTDTLPLADLTDSLYDSHRLMALDASHSIWSTVDGIVQTFYRQGTSDHASAKSFLDSLESISNSFPSQLKSSPPAQLPPIVQQEMVIANLHVACSYYYAVMITTRKFLVLHLSHKLAAAPSKSASEAGSAKSADGNAKLANTCIESAIFTLQACRETLDAGMLLANMCILKAWVFAAAMIIGFALFVNARTDAAMEQAFLGGNAVLQRLASHSPQAKHYFDILSAFYSAIKEHQRRKSFGQHSADKPMVTKIFSLGMGEMPATTSDDSSTDAMAQAGLGYEDACSEFTAADASQYPFANFGMDEDFTFDDIDSVAIQFWDDFLLGQEAFQ